MVKLGHWRIFCVTQWAELNDTGIFWCWHDPNGYLFARDRNRACLGHFVYPVDSIEAQALKRAYESAENQAQMEKLHSFQFDERLIDQWRIDLMKEIISEG
jgi:hypothetical protein